MKKTHVLLSLALVSLLSVSGLSFADKITGLKISTPSATVGVPVQVTIEGDNNENGTYCGVNVQWGDGSNEDIKIDKKDGEFPRQISHTYAKPGQGTIRVKGARAGSRMNCSGQEQSAAITILPPAGQTTYAAPAATKPACPEGWKLNAKSVDKKSGAYLCTASAKTKLPETKPTCPAGTKYTEKKGSLGCSKAK